MLNLNQSQYRKTRSHYHKTAKGSLNILGQNVKSPPPPPEVINKLTLTSQPWYLYIVLTAI